MMSKLDEVLDALMKSKSGVIAENASVEEKDELIAALREKKKKEIIDEIREKYKEELKKEVDIEAQKSLHKARIKELRSLMWNGFALAFVVGLAVNQVTDFIGYYKGSVNLEKIWPTNIIICVLFIICLALYLYSFVKQALELLDEKE